MFFFAREKYRQDLISGSTFQVNNTLYIYIYSETVD